MQCRNYIRVYRKTKDFTTNIVVFPDGCVYEMNDHPTHPAFGVCMFWDTINNFPDLNRLGKLYRDLTQLPDTVQKQIQRMVEAEPSYLQKGYAL